MNFTNEEEWRNKVKELHVGAVIQNIAAYYGGEDRYVAVDGSSYIQVGWFRNGVGWTDENYNRK